MEEAANSSFSGKKTWKNPERKTEECIMHYSSSQRILLVGEGDFSFSACLARAFGSAKKMVATSYDHKDKLLEKHWTARNHLVELKRLGCTLLHGINVKGMHEDNLLKAKQFDRIIYNFPHAGHDPELCERDEELILRHRELLSYFFSSARCLLSENGDIHVSHRDDQPYSQWRIRSSAKKRGLFLKEMVEFQKKDYPGYHNKRGGCIKSNKTFPLGNMSFTFKFSLKNDLEHHENFRKFSTENGEIHVSHRDDISSKQLEIRSSANERGLILNEMVEFQKKDNLDYHNERGGDIKSNQAFPLGNRSFTSKFSLKNNLEGNESFTKVCTNDRSTNFSYLMILLLYFFVIYVLFNLLNLSKLN